MPLQWLARLDVRARFIVPIFLAEHEVCLLAQGVETLLDTVERVLGENGQAHALSW